MFRKATKIFSLSVMISSLNCFLGVFTKCCRENDPDIAAILRETAAPGNSDQFERTFGNLSATQSKNPHESLLKVAAKSQSNLNHTYEYLRAMKEGERTRSYLHS